MTLSYFTSEKCSQNFENIICLAEDLARSIRYVTPKCHCSLASFGVIDKSNQSIALTI